MYGKNSLVPSFFDSFFNNMHLKTLFDEIAGAADRLTSAGPVLVDDPDNHGMKLEIELPYGYKKDEVKVHLDNGRDLAINWVNSNSNSIHTYSHSETLPDYVDPATLRAEYREGKLVIRVNYKEPEEVEATREINVDTNEQ